MRKRHNLYIFAVILALIAALIYMQKSAASPAVTADTGPVSTSVPAVTARVANVELAYPAQYATYERVRSPYTKTLNTIVWYENTDLNRSFFVGGKGSLQEPPVTMSLDVYDNPKSLSPRQLLSAEVPYMFVKGDGADMVIGGVPAKLLDWDGLYRGKSVMVNHKGLTYVFSVTSITPADAILKDFGLVLSSVSFK